GETPRSPPRGEREKKDSCFRPRAAGEVLDERFPEVTDRPAGRALVLGSIQHRVSRTPRGPAESLRVDRLDNDAPLPEDRHAFLREIEPCGLATVGEVIGPGDAGLEQGKNRIGQVRWRRRPTPLVVAHGRAALSGLHLPWD